MTQRSDLRFSGLLALSAVFAAPMTFAQNSNVSAEPANAATVQPATPAAPSGPATPAKKTWSDLDSNKDGSLDKTEAATIPSLQAVFDQADANADGALTGDEYKTYLAANGQGTPPKPKK